MPALRYLRQLVALNTAPYRSICAYIKLASKTAMHSVSTNPAACNCLALRQATRHVTQFYDQFISPLGLRATQYSILARLHRKGAMTINALAAELVMDRTTLGRNILPLQRDGLIAVGPGQTDRRSKELRLTRAGQERFAAAQKGWTKAQAQFERTYGAKRAKALRTLLEDVTSRELTAG
jgi:DNA-binding MarR family transcriptional regulator